MEKEVLLEVKNLSKCYGKENKVHALKNVSLNINKGEFTVILGSSGSGKSTLLNMIGGIDKPDSGSIIFSNHDICSSKDAFLTNYRKNDVGFIFQSFNLINDITVYENLLLQSSLIKGAIDPVEVLKMVGIEDKKDAYPKELSGGQQQRVAIGRALVKPNAFLLCDEPTGALDYETGKRILSLLETLVKEKGTSVIFVTHTKEIARMGHHIIRMRSGEVVEEYYNDEVVSSKEIDW